MGYVRGSLGYVRGTDKELADIYTTSTKKCAQFAHHILHEYSIISIILYVLKLSYSQAHCFNIKNKYRIHTIMEKVRPWLFDL